MTDYSHIETYEDAVTAILEYRDQMDTCYFGLGDLINYICPARKPGRPATTFEGKTLTELWKDTGIPRGKLSAVAANAEFYFGDIRVELQMYGWHRLAAARAKTGWRAGERVTEELTLRATKWLDAPREKQDGPTFEQRIARMLSEGERALAICPAKAKALLLTALETLEELRA